MENKQIWKCEAGSFSGYETETCFHLRGIRYAVSKRFEAPLPYRYKEGVHECIDPSPFCVQRNSELENYLTGIKYESLPQEESCQYLSITIPKTEELSLPVMVWYHGGGYRNGGCDSKIYDYELLAAEQNVILVGVNYRLGILGFGRTKEGGFSNHGLNDAIEGLRWVRKNIAAFGGDPENITIFGQSAGADLVRCILLSEGTDNLYHKAILQSDPIGTMDHREAMEERILEELRTFPDNADAEAIRSTEASILAHVKEKGNPKYMVFAPHFGIAPLPKREEIESRLEQIAAAHPMLIGSAEREVSVYGGKIRTITVLDQHPLTEKPIERIMKKLSDSIFIKPIERFARDYALSGGEVWLYTFFWRENRSYIGAGHSIDLLPLFGGQAVVGRDPAMGLSEEEIKEKGRPMRGIWASFARTGIPCQMSIPGMLKITKL